MNVRDRPNPAPRDTLTATKEQARYQETAEPIPEPGQDESQWPSESITCQAMARTARETGVWVVGGSIPERAGTKLYNTSTVWSPEGKLVAKYRKTHLFDLYLPRMTYKESDSFHSGESLCTFDTR